MEQKIKEIMANVFGISPDEIPENADSSDTKEWDSLKHMTLILALEEEFGIEFDEQQIVEMTSFKKLLDVIQGKAN